MVAHAGFEALVLATAGLLVAGVVKGSIGLGQNVVAVPFLGHAVGLKAAVPIIVLTNLATNAGQMWSSRSGMVRSRSLLVLTLFGFGGIVAGTLLFTTAKETVLGELLAGVIVMYVVVRSLRPEFRIGTTTGKVVGAPAAVLVGFLQGATGVSGPVLATYLNAVGFRKEAFVFTMAAVFEVLTAFQVAYLAVLRHYDLTRVALSAAALVPLLGGLAIGSALRQHLSTESFERIVLAGLLVLALETLVTSLA